MFHFFAVQLYKIKCSLLNIVALALNSKSVNFDVPEEYQMTLQDPATGIMEALIDFHHDLVFFFIIIVTLVFWLLSRLLYLFEDDHVSFRVTALEMIFRNKHDLQILLPLNFSKNVVAEVIWTIVPFLILLSIMPASFSLIYAMDDMMIPSVTMKCHGHQWFWNYNMSDTRHIPSPLAQDIDNAFFKLNIFETSYSDFVFSFFDPLIVVSNYFEDSYQNLIAFYFDYLLKDFDDTELSEAELVEYYSSTDVAVNHFREDVLFLRDRGFYLSNKTQLTVVNTECTDGQCSVPPMLFDPKIFTEFEPTELEFANSSENFLSSFLNHWLSSFLYSVPTEKKLQKLFFDSYMVADAELKLGQFRLLEVDKHICLPIQVFSRLLISAEDVIHSFAIPSLGIKMDAVPGRSNQIGVLIKRLGRFYGQCSEICGANHAFMPIVLECVSQTDFIKWYDANSVYLPL